MESRDPSSHSLELQMQAFYEHLRGGYPPPHLPSQLQQQQQSSPHEQQQQQQHHLHHLHYQQLQHHQQQQQQQQQQQPQQQQQHLNPPIIHSPAPLRQINPNSNLNNLNHGPNANPNPNPNPSSTAACYSSEMPPHAMPCQLQAASTSPPPGIGASMNAGAAMSPQSGPMFKKKRGRPRKYGTDGNGSGALVVPLNSAPPVKKKGNQGSSKKTKISTSGTTGEGLTPHVLTVGAGEDITAKIMTFSQHGPWAVCILSANGVISNASLWHSSISSGSVTYEGRFEILSLSGLFLLTQDGATRTRSGGFSVSLAGQDGSIIGGRVAGLLIAATPIQVVVGTFFPESRKSQARSGNLEDSSHMPPFIERQPCSPYAASGSAQGHVSGPSAGAVKEHHASHVMPLQSGDWGASDFDANTRSHSE